MLLNVEECLERYGSFYGIAKRVRSGELVKLERGLYSDTDEYVSGERRVAKKHPAAVFTMESAFLFHGLADVVPDRHSLATPARSAALADPRVRQWYVPAGTLDVGRTELEWAGAKLPVYDLERSLVELMRNRNKVPYDYYKEVLNAFRANLDRLYPAKLDDYLAFFPRRDALSAALEREVF